jgi:rhomboid protease GluP
MADSYPVPVTPPFEAPAPPRRYWPLVTLVTIAITFVVFLLQQAAGGSTNTDVLLDFGAAYGPYFRQGQYWRLVMPMFLHIGWLHILVNMYALYILGPILERVYGYGRYSLIYVGSGIACAYLSMTVSNNISAGASGAIFGVAGAMLTTGFLHRQAVPRRWGRAFGKGILILIVLNLLLGMTIPHIDNWGHVGGLIGGMVLAALIPPPVPARLAVSDEKPSQEWVWISVLVVVLGMGAEVRYYRSSHEVVRLLQQGERFHAAHKDDQALERFKQAAALAPHDERPHEMMGALYLDQKRGADAVREYQEALRLSPGSPGAQLGLALAYRQQGDLAKAQQTMEGLVGKNPSTAEGQMALADLLAERKLYALAVEHYEAALRIKPDLAVAHNNLAWLYATSDDPNFRKPQEALEHARRAVALSKGKQAAYLDTLAEAFYVNGQYEQAVRAQAQALSLEPDSKDLQEHMAKYRQAAAQHAAGSATLR